VIHLSDRDEDVDNDDVDLTDGLSDEEAERLLDAEGDADERDDDSDRTDKDRRRNRGDRRDRERNRERDRDRDDDDDSAASELAKWKALARRHERAYKETSGKLKRYEDEKKSETERLQDSTQTAVSRAEKAEAALRRREIAEDRAPAHATLAQIKAVAKRLSGNDDDELEADADELFDLLAPEPAKPRTPQRPKERMRGGGEPDDEVEETDPRKLADAIRRNR
jgi:hypothetical protein